MNIKHFIYIPFTGVGLYSGYRGDDWFKNRIEIFKNYTLKSLVNQSNKNFTVWCSFRAKEKYNYLTWNIARVLIHNNIDYVFTFNGLMYWDDKFPLKFFEKLTIIKTYKNRMNWRNFFDVLLGLRNRNLEYRIKLSLEELRSVCKEADYIYLTRLDSDDMLHKNAVLEIQKQEPKYKKALVFDKGYIYNQETGQLADWNPPTNPPFYTIMFPSNIFFHARSHKEYYGEFKSHEDVPKLFNCVTLFKNSYTVVVHGKGHISTEWEATEKQKEYRIKKYGHDFKGKEYNGYMYVTHGKNISTKWRSKAGVKNYMIGKEYMDKNKILKEFGL